MRSAAISLFILTIVALGVWIATNHVISAPPSVVSYQGRVQSKDGVDFDGPGQFKFALITTGANTITLWSNDSTSIAGAAPTALVPLLVKKGIFSVLLGDTTLTGMTSSVPASVFSNSDVKLRVWFNDGTKGFQLLSPDQRIASVGYSLTAANAENVSDGSITLSKLNAQVTNALIPIGSILPYAGPTAPAGFLMCDGTTYSRTQYVTLFQVIGTSHGAGDNVSTFHVPDYRGRFLRGASGLTSNDPDKLSRQALNAGGNTGNAVGTLQDHMFASHAHGVTDPGHSHQQNVNSTAPGNTVQSDIDIANTGPNPIPQGINTFSAVTNISIQANGGSETRPVNVSVITPKYNCPN